jgi:hypothetical protein
MTIVVQAVENEDDIAELARKGQKRTTANATTKHGMVLRACEAGVAGLDGLVASGILTLVLGVLGYTAPAIVTLLVACCYMRKHLRRKDEEAPRETGETSFSVCVKT